jgi:hypothetical protein
MSQNLVSRARHVLVLLVLLVMCGFSREARARVFLDYSSSSNWKVLSPNFEMKSEWQTEARHNCVVTNNGLSWYGVEMRRGSQTFEGLMPPGFYGSDKARWDFGEIVLRPGERVTITASRRTQSACLMTILELAHRATLGGPLPMSGLEGASTAVGLLSLNSQFEQRMRIIGRLTAYLSMIKALQSNNRLEIAEAFVSFVTDDAVRPEIVNFISRAAQIAGRPLGESALKSLPSKLNILGLIWNGGRVAEYLIYHVRMPATDTVTISASQAGGSKPEPRLPAVVTVSPSAPPSPSFSGALFASTFVSDESIPDDTLLNAGQGFTKTWRLRNSGRSAWSGCRLVFDGGARMGAPQEVSVPFVAAGASWDGSIGMTAPGSVGTYTGFWRLQSTDGRRFGERIYLRIIVRAGTQRPPTSSASYSVSWVGDVQVNDRDGMAPGQNFRKIWRLRNTSRQPLDGFSWVRVDGPGDLQSAPSIEIPYTPPGETFDPAVDFTAPTRAGEHISGWRLRAPGGAWVGFRCWVHIVVREPSAPPPATGNWTEISESQPAANADAPGFWREGPSQYWKDSRDAGLGGHMLWTLNSSAQLHNSAHWRPDLPESRAYEVFAFIPRLHATSRRAQYSISHAEGTSNVTIDQYRVSDAWVSLGTYRFNSGTGSRVRLIDTTGEASETTRLGFDSVKWQARDSAPPPPPGVTTYVSEQSSAASGDQPGFYRHGPGHWWYESTDAGLDGRMLWTTNAQHNLHNMGDWRPNLPINGRYEVFAFIPRLHATTTAAEYEIYHRDDVARRRINQAAIFDQWVSLGTYDFHRGSQHFVRLLDRTGEQAETKRVGFDSVKWEYRPGAARPSEPLTPTRHDLEGLRHHFSWRDAGLSDGHPTRDFKINVWKVVNGQRADFVLDTGWKNWEFWASEERRTFEMSGPGTYEWVVFAGNGVNHESISAPARFTILDPRPSVPTQLVAEATSPRRVELSWEDTSKNETGFQVERIGPGGLATVIATAPTDQVVAIDESAAPSTSFRYRVRALGTEARHSGWSNEVTVGTPANYDVAFVQLDPSTVTGGKSAAGVVSLDGPATQNTLVALASSSPLASVPASVTVPVGQSEAAFTVMTSAVDSAATAVIRATIGAPDNGGSGDSEALSIAPPVQLGMAADLAAQRSVKLSKATSKYLLAHSPRLSSKQGMRLSKLYAHDSSITVGVVPEGGQTFLAVSRDSDYLRPLDLALSCSDPSLLLTESTVHIPTGIETVFVPISAPEDSRATGVRQVAISVSGIECAPYAVPVAIADNDIPGIQVTPPNSNTTTEAGGSVTFRVVLLSQPAAAVSFDLQSQDATEGRVSVSTVTFTPEDWNRPQIITVVGVDDAEVDGRQTFRIVASASRSEDPIYNGLRIDELLFVNEDNDAPGVTPKPTAAPTPKLLISPLASTCSEADALRGRTVRARITRSSAGPALNVALSSSDITEVRVPPVVTIAPGALFADFNIAPQNDLFADGPQSVKITASALGLAPVTSNVLVLDDERPTLSVSIAPSRLSERGLTRATLTVSRNVEITPRTTALRVALSASLARQLQLPTFVTIPARAASVSVPIVGVDDTFAQGPRQVLVSATATGFVTGSTSLIITDDEVTSNGVISGRVLIAPKLLLGARGVSVTLRRGAAVLDVVTSDATGNFRFVGLPPSNYTIAVAGVGWEFVPASKPVLLSVPSLGAPAASVPSQERRVRPSRVSRLV